jgi:hypothetical protein
MPARTNISAVSQGGQKPLPPPPKLPDAVTKRFPEMVKWQEDLDRWRKSCNIAVFGLPGD